MLKKLWLSVLLAVCLVGASLTLAQEDLDETLEWEDYGITFDYPGGWTLDQPDDSLPAVFLAADEDDADSISSGGLSEPGDLNDAVIILLALPVQGAVSAEDGAATFGTSIFADFEADGDPEELDVAGGYETFIQRGFIDDVAADIIALDGDNDLLYIFILVAPEDLIEDSEDTIFAILDTVETSEVDIEALGGGIGGGTGGTGGGATEFDCCSGRADDLDVVEGDSLEYGDTVEGELTDDELAIGYTFEGAEGDFVTITVTTADDFDTYLVLLDEEGEEVAYNDDFEPGNYSLSVIGGELPADGVYTVVVTSFGGTGEGEFELTVDEGDGGGSGSGSGGSTGGGSTNSLEQYRGVEVVEAGEIAYGDTIEDETSDDALALSYSFEGSEGDEITISLEGSDDSDTYVALFDADGNELAYNDDFDGLNVSVIEDFELPEDGTYYIIVTSFSATDEFDFELSLED